MPNYVTNLDHATELIRRAQRILVIGCSGGGKTTLSRKLGQQLGLEHISMDRDFYWLPGWVKRPKAEERQMIAVAVASDRWLMDGTGSSTFDLRLPRTDIVLWVRMPRLLCIWGAVSRWAKWIGRTRPEMAPGCRERVDAEFIRYIWTFETHFAPMVETAIATHGPDVPVFQLKSRREMRRLLDLLGSAD